jgi:hypothetical protein
VGAGGGGVRAEGYKLYYGGVQGLNIPSGISACLSIKILCEGECIDFTRTFQ